MHGSNISILGSPSLPYPFLFCRDNVYKKKWSRTYRGTTETNSVDSHLLELEFPVRLIALLATNTNHSAHGEQHFMCHENHFLRIVIFDSDATEYASMHFELDQVIIAEKISAMCTSARLPKARMSWPRRSVRDRHHQEPTRPPGKCGHTGQRMLVCACFWTCWYYRTSHMV